RARPASPVSYRHCTVRQCLRYRSSPFLRNELGTHFSLITLSPLPSPSFYLLALQMHQRTLDFSASRLIRILFSDSSFEGLRDCFALILNIYPGCDAVATVVPLGIREDELLETAAKFFPIADLSSVKI